MCPGQMCAGQTSDKPKNAKIKNSRAFCEGYLARSLHNVIDNPHAAGSEAAAAYALGWADKEAGNDPLCCAPCADAYTP